jgi:hypothetical protein
MSRNRIILSAFAVALGLFLTVSTASAHPPMPPHPGPHPIIHPPAFHPAFHPPIFHPPFPPIIRPYPVVISPTVVVTDPLPTVVVAVPAQFRVMYRPTDGDPWAIYNDYSSQAYATDVSADLQRQHFETQILAL